MKNDRVEFDMNSKTVYGIMVQEDSALKVIADGGRMKYTVPFGRLRFSSKVLPKDPASAMDAWQVSKFAELREVTSDTTAYSATILLEGHPAISASNAGHGAPDRFAPLNGDYGLVLDFKASVRQWLGEHGVSEGEIADEENFWIAYRAKLAPYGVVAEQAIAEYFGESAEIIDESYPDGEAMSL
jgi:hypothetical protein